MDSDDDIEYDVSAAINSNGDVLVPRTPGTTPDPFRNVSISSPAQPTQEDEILFTPIERKYSTTKTYDQDRLFTKKKKKKKRAQNDLPEPEPKKTKQYNIALHHGVDLMTQMASPLHPRVILSGDQHNICLITKVHWPPTIHGEERAMRRNTTREKNAIIELQLNGQTTQFIWYDIDNRADVQNIKYWHNAEHIDRFLVSDLENTDVLRLGAMPNYLESTAWLICISSGKIAMGYVNESRDEANNDNLVNLRLSDGMLVNKSYQVDLSAVNESDTFEDVTWVFGANTGYLPDIVRPIEQANMCFLSLTSDQVVKLYVASAPRQSTHDIKTNMPYQTIDKATHVSFNSGITVYNSDNPVLSIKASVWDFLGKQKCVVIIQRAVDVLVVGIHEAYGIPLRTICTGPIYKTLFYQPLPRTSTGIAIDLKKSNVVLYSSDHPPTIITQDASKTLDYIHCPLLYFPIEGSPYERCFAFLMFMYDHSSCMLKIFRVYLKEDETSWNRILLKTFHLIGAQQSTQYIQQIECDYQDNMIGRVLLVIVCQNQIYRTYLSVF